MARRVVPLLALAALAAGCSSGSVSQQALTVGVTTPPVPPRGALVLAGESGTRAVALAVAPRKLVATVLSPEGGGLSGLTVSFRVGPRTIAAKPCGNGCYSAAAPSAARVEVLQSGSKPIEFRIPAKVRPGTVIVARAARATRRLKSLVYTEALRSGPKGGLFTTWTMKAPNELEYRIRGGADAVVIGERRWDRSSPSAPWRRSEQLPALTVPEPAWGGTATNAHVIGESRVAGRPVWLVTFANPTIPAWFTAWIDQSTYRPLQLKMTAASHFMFHRYLGFNRPLAIRPPR